METHQKRDDMNDSINQLLIRVLIQSELGLYEKTGILRKLVTNPLGPEVKDLIMFCNLYKVYHDKSNATGSSLCLNEFTGKDENPRLKK